MKYVEVNGEKFEIKNNFLDLGLLDINDISEIIYLDKIEVKHLELSSNNIVDIKGLDHLTLLRELDLTSNNISSIKGLENLAQTGVHIRLFKNPIQKEELSKL